MRRQNRHLRQITQRIEMARKRRDRIRIHHERSLNLCGKEPHKLPRLRCTPDAGANEHGVRTCRERERLLSCILSTEIAHALIGQRNDHHLGQLRSQNGIDALGHGERHEPRADAQCRLCCECRRPRHAERAGEHENTSARPLVCVTRTRRQQLCRRILCDE